MKRSMASLVLINAAVFYSAPVLAGGALEFGLGSTFDRQNRFDEAGAASVAYITDVNARYPTEIAGGWIGDDGSANSGDNVYVSVGKRVQAPNGLFAGAGLALATEETHDIKDTLNAKLQVGYARGPVVVKVEHLTSGGKSGESMAFVGYRHRF